MVVGSINNIYLINVMNNWVFWEGGVVVVFCEWLEFKVINLSIIVINIFLIFIYKF